MGILLFSNTRLLDDEFVTQYNCVQVSRGHEQCRMILAESHLILFSNLQSVASFVGSLGIAQPKTSQFNTRTLKRKRVIIWALIIIACNSVWAQPLVESRVYNWDELKPVKDEFRIRRQIIDGATTTLVSFTVHASTLEPGLMPHAAHTHPEEEELIIIRDGSLQATIKGHSRVLGPGSIAFVIPGEEHGFENTGDKPATYYVLKFKTNTPMDMERAVKAGGSFAIDWNELSAKETEKGARRNIVDRPTAMFKRFEMHVTTLNQGLSSHAPHTHPAEEMIIIRHGETSMQIGDSHHAAHPAAVVFLSSKIPHALTNKGSGACEYYAFQWE